MCTYSPTLMPFSRTGSADGDNAEFALRIVEYLSRPGHPVIWDETLHGYERRPNFMRTLLEFPLVLAFVQFILLAMLMVWAGVVRSAPPQADAVAGPASASYLVDNVADLLLVAGHGAHVLDRLPGPSTQARRGGIACAANSVASRARRVAARHRRQTWGGRRYRADRGACRRALARKEARKARTNPFAGTENLHVAAGGAAWILAQFIPSRPRLRQQVGKVVVGQHDSVQLLLLALLAEGHVLLEGVPGTAKTLMARTFAAVLQLDFNRIQFTPDLMPGISWAPTSSTSRQTSSP